MAKSKKKIIITGFARSGTHYSSFVLRRLGLKAGHEDVFDCSYTANDIDFVDYSGYDACVSYCAAPFLNLVGDNAIVVHQVRHPLSVVRTLVSTNNYLRPDPTTSIKFMKKHAPQAWEECGGNHRILCAKMLYYWNKMIEDSGRVDIFQQVEDPKFVDILKMAGYDLDWDYVEKISKRLRGHKPNSKTPPGTRAFKWDELPEELIKLGEKYGYE